MTLGLDARTLGALRAAPALTDALCAAVAAAFALRPGETLHDLHLRWSPGRAASAGTVTLLLAAPQVPLEEALVDYLAGAGEDALARSLLGARRRRLGPRRRHRSPRDARARGAARRRPRAGYAGIGAAGSPRGRAGEGAAALTRRRRLAQRAKPSAARVAAKSAHPVQRKGGRYRNWKVWRGVLTRAARVSR